MSVTKNLIRRDAVSAVTMTGKVAAMNEVPGNFHFIAEIGHGGMSEVFLTIAQGGMEGFQKLVVVKLLRADLAEDEEFRRMFLDEARLSARLNHPNVVQTNAVGEDQGRYYIAMEYLEGQTFERARRTRGASVALTRNLQLQMLVDVLSGLHYAHELRDYDNSPMGIVHRDVTPSNVFLTYDGQVKLLDFGIARIRDSMNQTRVGVLKGKARYMAPEQIIGTPLDRRADIYSVGVMLWEVLSGKQIWRGRSEAETLRGVASGEFPALPPDAPEELQQICRTAMAYQPQRRYATAAALRDELADYIAQRATQRRERGIGAVLTELFAEERQRIRQLVDAELKGVRTGTGRIPLFNDARAPSSSEPSMYDGNTGVGMVASVSNLARSAQVTYSGAQNARPPTSAHVRSLRRYALAGSLAVAAAAGGFVAFSRRGAPPPAPGATSAMASMATAPAPGTGRGSTVAEVRGVTDDAVTVGMSAAFSGASRELGNRMKLGLETAFATANETGGVAGRQIKLLAIDDGYEGKRALANVQELISDRHVFAILGNVGTPTTKEALPYVLAQKTLFFGAFTGTGLLRRDPPDRYVFNYRASYEEETAKMVSYLVDVKKLPDRSIVVFAQNDSYGDAGFEGATKTLRKKGHSDEILRVGYERNTLEVDDAVNKVVEYHSASVRLGNSDIYRPKHPIRAIIMVATYKAAAKFIQKVKDHKIDAAFLNVSFVGSSSLAEELKERGPAYGAGVIVTQVVPHYDAGATGIIRYRDALKKYHPDQQPDFISLEGYMVGQLFLEGLRRQGRELDTEKLVDTLEHLQDFDPGTGNLSFGMSQHQASHKVWGTVLDDHGEFRSLDMD